MSILKHPTKEEGEARLALYYKDADIMTAVKEGVYERVKELLGNGVDVNTREDDKTTILMWASIKGYHNIVKLLLDNGAKVNVQNNFGNSVFTYASFYRHKNIVKLLEQYGAI